MRALFHVFCFPIYAGLAGAVVFVALVELPWEATELSWLTAKLGPGLLPALGVAVLLGGGLVHEVATRLARDAERDRELDSLDYAY